MKKSSFNGFRTKITRANLICYQKPKKVTTTAVLISGLYLNDFLTFWYRLPIGSLKVWSITELLTLNLKFRNLKFEKKNRLTPGRIIFLLFVRPWLHIHTDWEIAEKRFFETTIIPLNEEHVLINILKVRRDQLVFIDVVLMERRVEKCILYLYTVFQQIVSSDICCFFPIRHFFFDVRKMYHEIIIISFTVC